MQKDPEDIVLRGEFVQWGLGKLFSEGVYQAHLRTDCLSRVHRGNLHLVSDRLVLGSVFDVEYLLLNELLFINQEGGELGLLKGAQEEEEEEEEEKQGQVQAGGSLEVLV